MAEFYKETKGKLKILAISINKQDSAEELSAFCMERSIEYTVLMDEEFRVTGAYGIKFTPTYFIVDPRGKISYVGAILPDDLDSYLK